jgi:hypothetical protein
MSDEKLVSRVELLKVQDLVKLPPSLAQHGLKPPTVALAKLGGPKALEIVKKKPGGAEVIAQLQRLGKVTPQSPGQTIGYSTVATGDPWYAREAELYGPNPTGVFFCCMYGINGIWGSRFNMPATDDLLALFHVQGGNGSVSVWLDGSVPLGSHPFTGDDWVVVLVSGLPASWHTMEIRQEKGYFHWLETEYIRL